MSDRGRISLSDDRILHVTWTDFEPMPIEELFDKVHTLYPGNYRVEWEPYTLFSIRLVFDTVADKTFWLLKFD